jgi:flagellar protein FlgJ
VSDAFRPIGALPPGAGAAAGVRGAAPPVRPAAHASAADRASIEDAAVKFESFFVLQMLRQMRSGTRELAGEDSIYGGGANHELLDMADMLFADSLASQRAFGIADLIVRQLLPSAGGTASEAALKQGAAPVASED